MAETPWTKGPWIVNPLTAHVEVPGRDAPICAMLWPTDLRSEDETYANARLIAVVPELAKALELALEYFADRQQRYRNRHPVWVKKARTALAKARGGARG